MSQSVMYASPPRRGEKRVIFDGLSWDDYKMMHGAAERWGGARVSYLDGTLELMFPSFEHESCRCLLAFLLEAWLDHQEIDFFMHGSTTLKKQLRRAGKEPDASYCFHRQRAAPDLALEVAITSGGLDTLEIYRRWSIPEVWIWQREQLSVHVLEDGAYTKSAHSRWFPDLDLKLLAKCARIENARLAKKKFLAGVKRK